MSKTPLLSVAGLQKIYGQSGFLGSGHEVRAVDGIDFEVGQNEILGLVGESGSGKSTLLNILGSLDSPTNGSIQLDGQELANLSEQELAAVRNKKIGFIFQSHHLLPQCSVLENVLVPTLAENGKAPADAVGLAQQLLERVELGHRLTHRPAHLSGEVVHDLLGRCRTG